MNCKALAVMKSGRTLKTLLTAIVVFASMITGMAQVPSYVPSNGLVGWWPFNGNANDESGNGNNGTVNGAILTSDRNGVANAAYSFDGVNDFIEVQNSSSFQFGNEETVSYWINFNSSSVFAYRYITKKGLAGQNGQFYSRLNPNNHIAHLLFDGNSYNSLVSSNEILDSSWVNIVHTYNGFHIKTYVNGILTDSIQSQFSIASNLSSLYIGADGNSQGFYSGNIDDIGIWNRALTQQEITNLYTASTPPPCNPLAANLQNGLVGYWPFCGNANDESGNGNNGTVNGAALTTDRFGAANSAYSFDGVNSYIIGNANTFPVGDRSISLWFRSNNIGVGALGRQVLGYGGQTCGKSWLMIMDNAGSPNGNNSFEVNSHCNIFSVTSNYSSIPNGSWHNWVATTSIAGTRFYIDGTLVLDTPVFVNSAVAANTNYIFGGFPNHNGIGVILNDPNNTKWNGELDDITVWNRVLTQNEITQLYTGSPCVNYQIITVTDTLIINANLSGINPVTFQNTIKVYPNPSSSQITIDFGANFNTLAGYTMRIQNAVGQTVYTTGVTQQQFTSNLNTWTGNGIYFVYLIDAQGNTIDVKKIILQ